MSAEPSGTVVYLAGNRRAVSAAQACWAEVHFFSSRHSAAGWAATHATTPGEIASHNNAAALGRAVFGGLLADD